MTRVLRFCTSSSCPLWRDQDVGWFTQRTILLRIFVIQSLNYSNCMRWFRHILFHSMFIIRRHYPKKTKFISRHYQRQKVLKHKAKPALTCWCFCQSLCLFIFSSMTSLNVSCFNLHLHVYQDLSRPTYCYFHVKLILCICVKRLERHFQFFMSNLIEIFMFL